MSKLKFMYQWEEFDYTILKTAEDTLLYLNSYEGKTEIFLIRD